MKFLHIFAMLFAIDEVFFTIYNKASFVKGFLFSGRKTKSDVNKTPRKVDLDCTGLAKVVTKNARYENNFS